MHLLNVYNTHINYGMIFKIVNINEFYNSKTQINLQISEDINSNNKIKLIDK